MPGRPVWKSRSFIHYVVMLIPTRPSNRNFWKIVRVHSCHIILGIVVQCIVWPLLSDNTHYACTYARSVCLLVRSARWSQSTKNTTHSHRVCLLCYHLILWDSMVSLFTFFVCVVIVWWVMRVPTSRIRAYLTGHDTRTHSHMDY